MFQALEVDSADADLAEYYDENLPFRRLWIAMLNVVYKDMFSKKHRPAAIRYVLSWKRGDYAIPFKDVCEALDLDYDETKAYMLQLAKMAAKLSRGEPVL